MSKVKLEAYGFRRPIAEVKRRLILAVYGPPKSGKTELALSAPKPMAYFNLDFGTEGVIEKHASEDIWVVDIPCGSSLLQDPNADEEAYMEAWGKFKEAHQYVIRHVRSVVWDTASETWELCRLAHFGKLTQVMPHKYTQVNATYRQLVRDCYDHDINLVLVHKLKEKYTNDKATGKMVLDGYKSTDFLVQVLVETWRKNGDFGTTITDCRQNPNAIGEELLNDFSDFEGLLELVFGEN